MQDLLYTNPIIAIIMLITASFVLYTFTSFNTK